MEIPQGFVVALPRASALCAFALGCYVPAFQADFCKINQKIHVGRQVAALREPTFVIRNS